MRLVESVVEAPTKPPDPSGERENPAETTASPGEDAEEPISCAEHRQSPDCVGAPNCLFDRRTHTCREVANECELLYLDRSWDTPVFDHRGDPCEQQRADCAWSPQTQLCEPFEAVTECPATADEAAALQVLCNHSAQPELSCSYPGTECRCRRQPHCGGAPPPPHIENPPAIFSCVPDFDERGCPNRRVREGRRCRVEPHVQCYVGCYGLYTCERGRWRRHRVPPRP